MPFLIFYIKWKEKKDRKKIWKNKNEKKRSKSLNENLKKANKNGKKRSKSPNENLKGKTFNNIIDFILFIENLETNHKDYEESQFNLISQINQKKIMI